MMSELQRHLERLTSWLNSRQQPLSWSCILIAEDADIKHGTISSLSRSALATPDEYSARFEEHLNAGHSWINMNAASVIEDTLLVVIELPSYSNTVPREKVSVNLSGPSEHTLNDIKILD
jgi:hypothetical protein